MVVDTVVTQPSSSRAQLQPSPASTGAGFIVTAANIPSLVCGQAMEWLVACLYYSL